MQPGELIPDLTVAITGSGSLSLRELIGTPFVLYFYPKDATPGCTQESLDFAALSERFDAAGVRLIGVSRDSLASHERFRSRQSLPFDLIADTDERLCRAFDVLKEKSMYGRKVFGIERSTFLFDRAGHLRQAWRGVKVAGHAQAVLDAATALT